MDFREWQKQERAAQEERQREKIKAMHLIAKDGKEETDEQDG